MIRGATHLARMRMLERAARLAGCAALAFCALAYATGELGRRADLEALEAPTTGLPASPAPPDQSLWSPTRLQEYASSLNIAVGPPVALLRIESVGVEVPVYRDTREIHLNRGAGLIGGMASPGEGGNLGIAAHRDGYFRGLKDLKVGDPVILRARGHRFVYRVASIDIVPKHDVALLGDTADPTITLVTCFPFYFVGQAPLRFVARALLERTFSDEG